MLSKGGWQAAANILNAQQGRTGLHKLCAANVYVSVNSARRLCDLPDTDTAPTDFSLPPEPPHMTLEGSAGTSGFLLIMLFAAGYPHAVLVEATNGVAAGKVSPADSAYAFLTVMTGGVSMTTPITDEYVAVWGAQEEGAQIAVRLTAINAAGMRGVPYVVTGVVALSSADGAQIGADELQKAA